MEATDAATDANAQEALEPASSPSEGERERFLFLGSILRSFLRHDGDVDRAVMIGYDCTTRHRRRYAAAVPHAMHKLDYRWA